MNTLYLVKPGILFRKENTLKFLDKEGLKKNFPIKSIEKIVCLAPVSLTSGVIKLLAEENKNVFFINKYGILYNTLIPPSFTLSGKVTIEQAKAFLERRKEIAEKFVLGAYLNFQRFFRRHNKNLNDCFMDKLQKIKTIEELMGLESNIWKNSYQLLAEIVGINFIERTKRPPKDELNALISFINTLVYTDLINEGRKTFVNLGISFLHQPQDSRFSLALDVAEVFKPVITFPLITYLINKKIIKKKKEFEKIGKGVLLNKKGKKKALLEYEKRMKSTIYVKKLRRKVSYRTLFKLEFYKLIKDFLREKEYEPYLHNF